MRHEQVIDNLSDYVEQTLDPAMRAAVDNHIRECADCKREVETFQSLFQELGSPALMVEVPGQFHDNVMRRVRLQQREGRSRAGFLSKLGWGWASAGLAGAAAVVAVTFLAVGPLHQGAPASFFFTPRWTQSRSPEAGKAPDLVVGSDGTPATAGQEYHLNLDFLARRAGNWKMTVQTSTGISLVNADARSDNRTSVVWEGPLGAGVGSGLTLMLQPSNPGSVQELIVRFHNVDDGYDVRRMVFIPVQTGGQPGASVDWQSRPNGTLRGALEDVARSYGTPVTAPVENLDQPASFQMRDANAGKAIEAIAHAQGLRFNLYTDTYNLYQ